jgi:hypothetical protein
MKRLLKAIFPACLLTILSQTAIAEIDLANSDQPGSVQTVASIERWQMQMIYQPSQSLLKREQRGFVNIYDGFTDVQVEKILDDKFDRIDNMMFSRVKITDTSGTVKTNPATGYAMVEDDGCD